MEDLFGAIIVIIGIIGSIVSSAKKEKAKKVADEQRRSAAASRVQTAQKKQPRPPVSTPVQPPRAARPPLHEQAITPTVHTHLQPDCATHDVPGSLGTVSMEGKDPCHEDQLRHERSFPEADTQQGGLTFDWSGENLVKAFVMQEVLTRPCQRSAR